MLHAWIKNIQRLPNISWRILSSKQRVHWSPMPNEHPVSMKGPITITPPAWPYLSVLYYERLGWGPKAKWSPVDIMKRCFNRVHKEPWILETVMKFVQQFSRPEKSLENGNKVWKNGKKSWVFSPVLLLPCIMKKSFVPLLITYSIPVSLEKEIIVVEKSLEKVLNFQSKNLYKPCINANKAGRACTTALIT